LSLEKSQFQLSLNSLATENSHLHLELITCNPLAIEKTLVVFATHGADKSQYKPIGFELYREQH
jgi:hypothetical protein